MSITYLIIGTTVLISYLALNNADLFFKLKHWPYAEARRKEYYRWITNGFLHGDYMHLLFNMITLYYFGRYTEQWFGILFGQAGTPVFLAFYLLAIAAACSGTFIRHKDNPGFASIGASGAVAAVLFASILFEPTIGIRFFFIPIDIPGFLFGIGYLWYSNYAAERSGDGIDHLAHFFGALFGFFFPVLLRPELIWHFFARLGAYFGLA